MVSALLDSSVLVDVLRGYEPAQTWLAGQNVLGVTSMVWLEIIDGAQNKASQKHALSLLRRFNLVKTTDDDLAWAVEKLLLYGLSHHLGAFDCLIAAAPARLNIPLYTRNLKHFRPILGSLAVQPY
jgi:predicted nucleic acid-binding protein